MGRLLHDRHRYVIRGLRRVGRDAAGVLTGGTDESFSAFCPPSRKGDDLADDVVGLDELDHRPGGRNAVGPFFSSPQSTRHSRSEVLNPPAPLIFSA